MEYFVGLRERLIKREGHEAQAGEDCAAGQRWANRVLRKEDMQIYVLRLLLEYAQVADERRDIWAGCGSVLDGGGESLVTRCGAAFHGVFRGRTGLFSTPTQDAGAHGVSLFIRMWGWG